MNKPVIGLTIMFVAVLLPNLLYAQEFKLPSLFPFKKQSHEVKPIQLSDYAAPQTNSTEGPWDSFAKKSKGFFSRTGEGISKFSADMRKSLKNMESPGWQFDKKSHWWNDEPDMNQLHSELERLKWHAPQYAQPPQPQARTAQGLQASPPRHRF